MSWNSLCRSGWPCKRSTSLCLPSSGTKGMSHHTWPDLKLMRLKNTSEINFVNNVASGTFKLYTVVSHICFYLTELNAPHENFSRASRGKHSSQFYCPAHPLCFIPPCWPGFGKSFCFIAIEQRHPWKSRFWGCKQRPATSKCKSYSCEIPVACHS